MLRTTFTVLDMERLIVVMMMVSLLPMQRDVLDFLRALGNTLCAEHGQRLAQQSDQQKKREQAARHSGGLYPSGLPSVTSADFMREDHERRTLPILTTIDKNGIVLP